MQDVNQLANEFKSCQKILLALGDENRQHLILTMLQMGECGGVRVGTITERTHLSRPAVSHHLGILKNAGLVKVRHKGTKNYYRFDENAEALDALLSLLAHAKEIMENNLASHKE